MKWYLRKKDFLFTLIFLQSVLMYAADPTTSASNVQFPVSYLDGGQFTVTFTPGNGTGGRIVVVKEGSDITGVPVDGVKYNTSASFKTPGTEFTAAGEYVVGHLTGSNTSLTVTNLTPGTTYYVAIFELNGNYNTPSTIDYSVITPKDRKVTTLTAPTSQASITSFTQAGGGSTQVGGNAVRVNWTNGNGQGRMIVARKGTTLTATPQDLKNYNYSNSFGANTSSNYILDAETFVVNKSSASHITSVDITGLEPNTTYTFAIFEYNGSNSPVYLKTLSTNTVTTNAGPTKQAANVGFISVDGNKLSLNWAMGNGSRRIVIAKKGSSVTSAPVNGEIYTADAQFGSGEEMVPGSGEFVVYSGTGNSVAVTNLEKFTEYHFAVYEYDTDKNGYTYYLTSIAPARGNRSTALPPTGQTTLSVSNITGSSAQLTYHLPSSGAGTYRMLVMKDGGPTDFLPEDLKLYNHNTDTYGTGTPVATGTYILIGHANGGAPNVKGLVPGHTYYATVFDMNGATAPVYKTPGFTISFTVPNEPTVAPKNPNFVTVDGNFIRFDWTNGDGARRIVVAKKGSAVTSLPQDGTVYTASSVFGTASSEISVGTNEFVVYDGTGNSVNISNLEKATTYHFAVFEYNLNNGSPDYLTASTKWLAASRATVSAPTLQTSNISAFNIQSTQSSISFTVGNGSSRIFVMREGSAVNGEPTDLTSYQNGSDSYGVPGTQIGTGNFVVAVGKQSAFTVSNLKPGTQYYITAFEYNGNNAPVYTRPGATVYNFTTTGAVVVNPPTQAASTPVFEKIDGNKFTFKWTNGDGANRMVIARKGSAVSFVPVDGSTYTADASFGSSTDLGNGQYVVYNGDKSAVNITNLDPNAIYHFAVFEYNGSGSSTKYATSALQVSQSTASTPTTISSSPSVSIGSGSLTLSWSNGNGDGRVVVAREESEVSSVPSNLTKYTGNSVFKNGQQIGIGEYIVYAGSGNTVTVTGLEANKTYHFSVFEYNGIDAPVYNTTEVLKMSATVTSVLPVTWHSFQGSYKDGQVYLEWKTAGEKDNVLFEVERSADGKKFQKIGSVRADGEARNIRQYQFVDKQPGTDVMYYRIRQVDHNGNFSFSKTIQIKGGEGSTLVVLQNPAGSQLNLKCSQALMGGRIMVAEATGKVVFNGIVNNQMLSIPISHLPAGVYYVTAMPKDGSKKLAVSFLHQ